MKRLDLWIPVHLYWFLVLSTVGLFVPGPAVAQLIERHALVIGNSSYSALDPLENPRNDATDIAEALSGLGYKLHSGGALLDLDLESFERAIQNFSTNLPNGAVALFYFAGHGIATDSDNYLIPVNTSLLYETQLRSRAVSLRDTMGVLAASNPDGLSVALLDACRNNPLPKSVRSATRGLRRIQNLPQGSFIGYAADQGQVAIDSDGLRNGLYTGELLKAFRSSPGIPIELIHKKVAASVLDRSLKLGQKQLPVFEQKFVGDYCIGSCLGGTDTGRFELQVEPKAARVCFFVDDWRCGADIELQLGRDYSVFASAVGYQEFEGKAMLARDGQPLSISLVPQNSGAVTKIETAAPTITHRESTEPQTGHVQSFSALVSSASRLSDVVLHYQIENRDWQQQTMEDATNGNYIAAIEGGPGDRTIAYFFTATDINGREALSGSRSKPWRRVISEQTRAIAVASRKRQQTSLSPSQILIGVLAVGALTALAGGGGSSGSGNGPDTITLVIPQP